MTEPTCPVSEEDLLRYVDGQVDPNRREEIERHLVANPADGMVVTAYRHQNRLLRETFDGILDEGVPAHIAAAAAAAARPRYARAVWAAAAGLLLFVAGAASGIYGSSLRDAIVQVAASPDIKSYALAAHRIYTPEVLHPVEVVASQEQHLVQWLSKRLGHPLKAPQLQALGFDLVGGRLLAAADGQPAAQLMYQDRGMRRLTLYLRQADASEDTSFRFARSNDISMFYWIDAPWACALVGAMDRDELYRVSRVVYDQMSH